MSHGTYDKVRSYEYVMIMAHMNEQCHMQDGYVHLDDKNGFGTNSAFISKGDGEGTSVKDQV